MMTRDPRLVTSFILWAFYCGNLILRSGLEDAHQGARLGATFRTYVGRPAHEGGRTATLRLSIPSDFHRTTFHKEFYGRQFTLIDGRLVTDIPWAPGHTKAIVAPSATSSSPPRLNGRCG